MDVVKSVNGVPIRLTDERWDHIVGMHEALTALRVEVLRTVAEPFAVVSGTSGELRAVRRNGSWWIVVTYREVTAEDGFIITAFLTRGDPVGDRVLLWP